MEGVASIRTRILTGLERPGTTESKSIIRGKKVLFLTPMPKKGSLFVINEWDQVPSDVGHCNRCRVDPNGAVENLKQTQGSQYT